MGEEVIIAAPVESFDFRRDQEREAIRAEIEAAIELLIDQLDALDAPAEDLEPDGEDDRADDEPSLGAPERHPTVPMGLWPGVWTDRTTRARQTLWAAGGDVGEREDEDEHGGDIVDEPHDEEGDREPDVDSEPWLGWTSPGWSHGYGEVHFGAQAREEDEWFADGTEADPNLRWSGRSTREHCDAARRQAEAIRARVRGALPAGNLRPIADLGDYLIAAGYVAADWPGA